MIPLKFSHDYEKLPKGWDNTTAFLAAVVHVSDFKAFRRAHPAIIAYDTRFRGEEGSYPLEGITDALLLFMLHERTGQPFMTIRRFTVPKQSYYREQIGADLLLRRVTEIEGENLLGAVSPSEGGVKRLA